MNKVLLATTAIAAFSLAACASNEAAAADVSGEISLDIVKDANDNYTATPGIDMAIDGAAGVGSIGLTVDGSDTVKLDTWSLGAKVGAGVVSFGDQGDLMEAFEGSTEAVGGQTLTDLDDDYVSLKAEMGQFGALVGFSDISTDVSELQNVQLSYAAGFGGVAVDAGVNWDKASKDITVGLAGSAAIGGAAHVGGAVTYTEALTGFEVSAGYDAFRAFANGDENDAFQNVGGGLYKTTAGGLSFYGEVGYNIDAEEITPAAGVSFNF